MYLLNDKDNCVSNDLWLCKNVIILINVIYRNLCLKQGNYENTLVLDLSKNKTNVVNGCCSILRQK